jgi:hypothetical protein
VIALAIGSSAFWSWRKSQGAEVAEAASKESLPIP